jgi:hypothetical protein
MVAQFYNVEKKEAYQNGWAFPENSEYPEGNWIKVVSAKRVSVKTLARKAKKIVDER